MTPARLLQAPPIPSGVLAGFSGGLDSSVLLHLLAGDPDIRARGLRAIHVHHGLHADADAWAAHCARTCASLGVPLQVVHVDVDRGAGLGLEGAARVARHRAFAEALDDGEILALAHHRDDQAETFLLRALRGSGADGLAAMRPWREYARGWLWRPLLASPRARLRAHAQANGLDWIEDPANASTDIARNFLRHRVLPLLAQHWPQATDAFAHSAGLCGEAADLLAEEDSRAQHAALRDVDTLSVDALLSLPAARRARVLRHWIASLGLPPLPATGIAAIEHGLLPARRDTQARFEWAGARVQRWRDLLHAGPTRAALPQGWSLDWDGTTALALPTGDALVLSGTPAFELPLRVHARAGGERIALPGRSHSHALKHVLQDAGVPPWRRERMPLLSAADGELLAAGDAIVSERLHAWLQARNARLRWTGVA